MEITVITYESPEYHEMLALRYQMLREPWGLSFSTEDLQGERDDTFIVCHENGTMVGCCILTRLSDTTLKLRQMAVDQQWQGKNIGRRIVGFAEKYAVESGYSYMELHARKTAAGFYEKCGYEVAGKEFVEIGMAHVKMRKRLG